VEKAHQVLVVALEEPPHPRVMDNARLTVVPLILRCSTTTLPSTGCSVTQRSDAWRFETWKERFRRLYDAVLVATAATLAGIMLRSSAAEPALRLPRISGASDIRQAAAVTTL
jgi:hypothetical protein